MASEEARAVAFTRLWTLNEAYVKVSESYLNYPGPPTAVLSSNPYRAISLIGNRHPVGPYRGTSLIRDCYSLGPYGRPIPRALRWS
jgi:hypothetical protein